jgi:hypothetical protein
VTVADTTSFEVDSFSWDAGAFTLTGRWTDDVSGRVRLLIDVDGRQRNIGAQGGKTAGGDDWRATFVCAHEPDQDAAAALKLGADEIPLPAPELAPPPGAEARSLLEELRAERVALDRARHALARERKAAEEIESRLSVARRRVGEPAAREDVAWLGYVVAAAIAILFLLVLIWVL